MADFEKPNGRSRLSLEIPLVVSNAVSEMHMTNTNNNIKVSVIISAYNAAKS